MKNLSHSFFIILIFSFFSCQSSEEGSEIQTFAISESDISAFDEVVTSIEFIPLKNKADEPVNLNCSVWNLKVTEKFLVYTTLCNPESKIHLFDHNGNYLKSFERSGNGPEEYQIMQGIDLNQDTLSITVGAGLIKQYHFPDFEFIGTVNLDKEAMFLPYFTKISKTKWLTAPMHTGELDENGEYKLYKIMDSSDGKTVELPIGATPLTAEISEGEFAKLGQSYLLNYAFSDTIYQYKNDQVTPYASLDFGERKPSADDLKMDGAQLEATVTNQPFVINMGKIWQTDSISRIKTFALAKNPDMDITNMRTFPVHEVFLNHETNQVTAFKSLAGWSNGKGDAKDGYFYDVLRTDDWIYALENGTLGKYAEQLEKSIGELGDFEDPILIKYQVKMKN
ncbi:6-bladed beta-propeller [Algoriphagus yeomjeoni]|uniref:6-bladed beta-propeller protein n=1 Tax=Algoriphagus yeomjeoni TaxID=291403 RepID=A0A327P6X0_9BACT|nr:6-bladed beta-propeller [Algoriphagus yeomjeoni]RAI88008.1 6-bladed beta-propeller protein [Algoriphagus yeomjeoni]